MADLWLAVDPGETVGWSLWEDTELIEGGQTELLAFRDDVWDAAFGQIVNNKWTFAQGPYVGIRKLVVEEFRLYPWIVAEGGLDFDELRTSRLIGGLELIARMANWDFYFQPATIKKPALANGAGEFFEHPLYPNRHMNDSIMHGWFHSLTFYMGMAIALPTAEEAKPDPQRIESAVMFGAPPSA